MTDEQAKHGPGRPAERPMPEPISDTFTNIVKALVCPVRKDREGRPER